MDKQYLKSLISGLSSKLPKGKGLVGGASGVGVEYKDFFGQHRSAGYSVGEISKMWKQHKATHGGTLSDLSKAVRVAKKSNNSIKNLSAYLTPEGMDLAYLKRLAKTGTVKKPKGYKEPKADPMAKALRLKAILNNVPKKEDSSAMKAILGRKKREAMVSIPVSIAEQLPEEVISDLPAASINKIEMEGSGIYTGGAGNIKCVNIKSIRAFINAIEKGKVAKKKVAKKKVAKK